MFSIPTVGNVLIFLIFSLGLRWFLFKYKLLHPVREYLKNKHPVFVELFHCPYCQTFEASVIVYFLMGMPFNLVPGFLCGLFNAYVAIAIENMIESQIDKLEGIFEIDPESEKD
jgi:hypothetical protein